jgi:uncharacterized protein YjdB/beta-N-acetylglucosaminidase
VFCYFFLHKTFELYFFYDILYIEIYEIRYKKNEEGGNMVNNNNKNIKIKTGKILKYITVMTVIVNIVMSSFVNIINAVIYTNLPISQTRYNAVDNSSVFPDSYKQYIKNLKAAHPNWVFKAVYTGLDWTESVRQESYDVKTGISLVPDSSTSNWKKDNVNNYIDGSFVIASKKAVAYTLDPRNYLNETGIFQFEALDFNNETSTTSTIDKIISGTTMSTYPTQYKKSENMITLENGLTWAQIIINAAKNAGGSGISSVFLASRMKQETSLEIINNGSINGSSTIYPGIYNFFNIGSVPNADGQGSVTNGLAYASSKGWTTPAASINASATVLWSSYIKWGQNTIYFQKFDVNNPPKDINNPSAGGVAVLLYGSQYMTNILAPTTESKITYNAYSKSSMLDSNFVFYVPVYENMPSIISPHPDSQITQSTISGTDIIYLDDTTDTGVDDVFFIRSSPEKIGINTNEAGNNIIATIVESLEGAENRTKFTRSEIGTNGWDKIRLNNGTDGYISQTYTKTYDYTHVTGITLSQGAATLKIGENTTLTANILPTNSYIKNLTWNSTNSSIASVDSNGKVNAITIGTANITATTLDGNKVATCAVTVGKTLASSISVNSTEFPLVIGNYLQVAPTVLPATTTDSSYDISVADITIATVENGKIKGLKTGDTIVTLKTKDGSNKTCTFTLKVTETVATLTNLTVDNTGIITKIALGTTAKSITDNITTNYTEKLLNVSGTVLADTDKVGTGTKVQIISGTNILQEYTIVIYGDINGDAKVSASDYVFIKNNIMATISLNNVEKLAADYNNDGKVTASDYVLIKNYIMK